MHSEPSLESFPKHGFYSSAWIFFGFMMYITKQENKIKTNKLKCNQDDKPLTLLLGVLGGGGESNCTEISCLLYSHADYLMKPTLECQRTIGSTSFPRGVVLGQGSSGRSRFKSPLRCSSLQDVPCALCLIHIHTHTHTSRA